MSSVAEGHAIQPPAEFLSPIIEDTPCPTCTYNLRGLREPRCPECGLTFEWWDIYRFRRLPAERRERRRNWVYLGIGGAILVVLMMSGVGVVLAGLLVVIGGACAIVLVQAEIEKALLSFFPNLDVPRKTRSWFAGALIGDFGILVCAAITAATYHQVAASSYRHTSVVWIALMWVAAAGWATWVQYIATASEFDRRSDRREMKRRLVVGCALLKSTLAVGAWVMCLPGNP